MQPTTSRIQRTYCIQLGSSSAGWPSVICIVADCMTIVEPSRHMRFKREDKEVGEVNGNIAAWWIEETVVS